MYSYAPTGVETDDSLRKRLEYVAADGPYLTQLIAKAAGHLLDEIASYYNLRRRQA